MFVSILLPVYNGERWLEEAVDSILFQTYPDWELLAIDDGSTDGSRAMLDRYAQEDSRIRVLSHPNWGIADSLNHAITEAQHDWLVRMDADDVMHPQRIERQLAFIRDNPDVGVASSLVTYIDANGRFLGTYSSDLTTRDMYFQHLHDGKVIGFHHPATIMRKDLVQQAGGYRAAFWPAEDLDLWNRIAELDTVLLVQPEYLLDYRIHGSSISHNNVRNQHLKVLWVEHSMLARRRGEAELPFDRFVENQQGKSIFQRLDHHRLVSGMIYYKVATLRYSAGDKPGTLLNLAAAMTLHPRFTARELNKKFLHISRPGIPGRKRKAGKSGDARAGNTR